MGRITGATGRRNASGLCLVCIALCWNVGRAQDPQPLPNGWRTAHIHEPRLAALQAQGVLSQHGVNSVLATAIGIPLFTDTLAAVEWVNTSILRQLGEAFRARAELACRCNRASRAEDGDPLYQRGKRKSRIADRIAERSFRIAEDCRRSGAAYRSSCDTLVLTAPGSVDSLFIAENSRLERTTSELGPWTCPDPGPDSLFVVLSHCGLLDAEARSTFGATPIAQHGTSLELLQKLVSHYSDRAGKRHAERRMLFLLDSLTEWGYLTHERRQLLLEYSEVHTELPDHVLARECNGAFEVRSEEHADPAALVQHIADRLKVAMPMLGAFNAARTAPDPKRSNRNGPELLTVADFPHVPWFLGPLNQHLCNAGSDERVLVIGTARSTSAPSSFVVLPMTEPAFSAWMSAIKEPLVRIERGSPEPPRYRPTIGTTLGRDDKVFSASYCTDSSQYWQKCFQDWGMLDHVPGSAIDSVRSRPDAGSASVLDLLEQFPASHVDLRQLLHHPTPYVEMLWQLSAMSNGAIRLTSAREHRQGNPLKGRPHRQGPQHRPIRSVVFIINGQRVRLRNELRSEPMSTKIINRLNLALREAGSERRVVTMTGDRWPCVFINAIGHDRLTQLDWVADPVQW